MEPIRTSVYIKEEYVSTYEIILKESKNQNKSFIEFLIEFYSDRMKKTNEIDERKNFKATSIKLSKKEITFKGRKILTLKTDKKNWASSNISYYQQITSEGKDVYATKQESWGKEARITFINQMKYFEVYEGESHKYLLIFNYQDQKKGSWEEINVEEYIVYPNLAMLADGLLTIGAQYFSEAHYKDDIQQELTELSKYIYIELLNRPINNVMGVEAINL